ncbi:MAG: hypothetical protein KA715_12515 [Xanthomonadaceae bacterium]|nr:hypothetical protein [Xanthomonadaceae bacterium]
MLLRILMIAVMMIGCGKLKVPKAANSIALTSSVSQWVAGQCVDITLSLSQSGSAFVVPGTTTAQIGLSGNLSGIRFYETGADCAAATGAVTITTVASATSSKTFYANSTASGALTLTTRLAGYLGTPITVSLEGTQEFTVYAATPVNFMFALQSASSTDLNGADSVSAATAGCTPYFIYFKDTYGNVVSSTDFTTLYTATFAGLNLVVNRDAGDATIAMADYGSSNCSGTNVVPSGGAKTQNNAFTTYPAPFSIDPTGSVGGTTIIFSHALTGITPNPTFTLNVSP